MVKGGVHGMHPPLRDTAGQCAGSTHPTGMHSCFHIFAVSLFIAPGNFSNVKSDVSGYNKITFQGCRRHLPRSFLMAQPKSN